MSNPLDANSLLQTGSVVGGLLALAIIIFAETGLLVGFFLPGDTLLIAAGVFAAQGKLPLLAILPVAAVAAIAGYEAGYHIGRQAGTRLFKRTDGLFREEYVTRTEDFFHKHGGKTVLFARFIAVVRTVIPLVAGMGKMNRRRYWLYNVTGAIIWTFSVTLAAYWLGKKFGNKLDKYILALVFTAIVVTSGTVIIELFRSPQRRRELFGALRTEIKYLFKK